MIEDNEKRVRAFYEATVPGHQELSVLLGSSCRR